MKYLCLVYGEEQAISKMPDEHCVAFDEEVRKSGQCSASEAMQWPLLRTSSSNATQCASGILAIACSSPYTRQRYFISSLPS